MREKRLQKGGVGGKHWARGEVEADGENLARKERLELKRQI